VSTRTFVNGRVYVRRTRCATCVFGPNKFVDDERVAGMVEGADKNESCIPCHKHLYEDQPIEPVCRGYFDRRSSVTLRLAEAMGLIEWVEDNKGGQ
jgi:hypothetical protein